MAIYVSGSLAYDRIMTFPGEFSDYILPDKIHMLNVCFPIGHLDEKRGGCGGNIAYNLALLGEKSLILTSVGRDFGTYKDFLEGLGLSLEGVKRLDDEFTAGAYITTDRRANQIIGFHAAAMNRPCGYAFPRLDPAADLGIIAPSNSSDMAAHAVLYQERGVRYIFDPGQQITSLSPGQIKTGISGALALVSNDYELELISGLTGLDLPGLLELTPAVITTLGGKGSRINLRGGAQAEIAPVRLDKVEDPTGAGDAYRAGLLKGLAGGLALSDAARLGSACASFCVEQRGTQEHYFDEKSVRQRLEETYQLRLPFRFTSLPRTGGGH